MTDMNPIASTQIAKGTVQAQPLAGASSGVTANFAGAGNFWDMIFSTLIPGGDGKNGLTNPLVSTDSAPKPEKNPMALLQIALSNQTVDENGNIILPQAANEDVSELKSSLELTNTIINHLKNALPENAQKEGIFSQLISKLQSRADSLEVSLQALQSGTIAKGTSVDDIPMPMMIALGLTPSEIAHVADDIKALEEKLGREVTVEDLIAGIGTTVPQQQAMAATLPVIDASTLPSDDLAAQLNAMDVGGEEPSDDLLTDKGLRAGTEREGTEDIGGKVTHADAKKAAMDFKDNLAATTGAKPQTVAGSAGEILIPLNAISADSDPVLWQQLGLTPTSSLNLGPVAQAAAMTAGNTLAGQSHPATQMVAATMTRAGKEGMSDTMTLRLDPPELGSVNIRLEFGKDKMVKAHLTVEKPETYLMLQRDGLALERALQNAGLDANSSSISFELAQGGGDYTPDNEGKGGGEKNFGSRAGKNENAAEEISSTMTWAVDSETGHVRYNIMA